MAFMPDRLDAQGPTARSGVTSADLVRRGLIPFASLSPDGGRVAYQVVCGDPDADLYWVELRIARLDEAARPTIVARYEVAPGAAFNTLGWVAPGLGDFRWTSAATLLFTHSAAGRMDASFFDVAEGKATSLLSGMEELRIEQRAGQFFLVDEGVAALRQGSAQSELGRRIGDMDNFFSAAVRPANAAAPASTRWEFDPRDRSVRRIDAASQRPAAEAAIGDAAPRTEDVDATSYLFGPVQSQGGQMRASVRYTTHGISEPASTFQTASIFLTAGATQRRLSEEYSGVQAPLASIIGWAPDDRAVNVILPDRDGSTVARVGLDGGLARIARSADLLTKPCPVVAPLTLRDCRVQTEDGRTAILVRSGNFTPDELIRIDLTTGSIRSVDNPNAGFAARKFPRGSVYVVPGTNGGAWGRLYLPPGHRRGQRHPLVFTQYSSSPGFAQAVGDEIPIAPLLQEGIAVFDMYSSGLGMQSSTGDFRHEVERLRRPLEGMKRIAELLEREGLIDRSRMAVTGLSYGAEIAMYAYWNWPELRTVSAAGGSTDPNLFYSGGPRYAAWLARRGLPAPDVRGLPRWTQISAALNARSHLPPLLLQTPDSERAGTTGSWTALRVAGAPVEWYEYADEGHIKRHPATRLQVLERNLQWIAFWLTGRTLCARATDCDPFTRWERMESAPRQSTPP